MVKPSPSGRSPPPADRAPAAKAGAPARCGDAAAELSRLLPMWPGEIDDNSRHGRLALLARLRRALRAERQRGLAGHWAYDLARHARLLAAYRAASQAVRGTPPDGSSDKAKGPHDDAGLSSDSHN